MHPSRLRLLLLTLALTSVSTSALGEKPIRRASSPPGTDSSFGRSLSSRAASETTWVRVHLTGLSPCPGSSVLESGQTVEEVWCFEGAGGDSSWPANPPGRYSHWSKYDPPEPQPSKWHVTERHGGPSTGSFNAWAGCDSLGTNPNCDDVSFWIFQEGYGDDWNFPLVLDCRNQDASAGGTLTFDLRYDCEALYDYLYLEYEPTPGTWLALQDSLGLDATWSGDSGGWLPGLAYDFPARPDGIRFRWRAFSDFIVSDADGRIDTDGIGAIDNVLVTFAANGATVTDDFETGDFQGIVSSEATSRWKPLGLDGNAWDGWHLEFEPSYANQGNTCNFVDDWMWAARPAAGGIPENGFDTFLVTPAIDVSGWTGGVVEFDHYLCVPAKNEDYVNELVRTHDSVSGSWSLWNDFDGFITFEGCEFWGRNTREDLTPYVGGTVDSLQVAWEIFDFSEDGSGSWGKHGKTQVLVDNVAIGSFDATVTEFTAREIDLFADTFSLSDPAHTAFLANVNQGKWIGTIGLRPFVPAESLSVDIKDSDGITAANVLLWWRHDDGGSGFGSWHSKGMNLSLPHPQSTTDEGVYRIIVGRDDGGVEDLTAPGDQRIWKAGTTVEYYLKVTDDAAQESVFPVTADDPSPEYLEIGVLPFGHTSVAQGNETYLLVDDFDGTLLDFENSSAFDPDANGGQGGFGEPRLAPADRFLEEALQQLGLEYDRYDVMGAGSSISSEPRGLADSAVGVGGFLDDAGNPAYDGVLWLHGTLTSRIFTNASKQDLETLLDGGGKLLTYGDGVAFHLGTNDPVFLRDYLGTVFAAGDDATDVPTLNVEGEIGSPLEGVTLGLYSNCARVRLFDRLGLAAPGAGRAGAILMTYAAGGPGDDGRAAVIRNTRTASGGVAVLAGFDVSALLSTSARACLVGTVIGNEFGLTLPSAPDCANDGVDVGPETPVRLEFSLGNAAPNPFRAGTTIRYGLPRTVPARLAVYDVTGRRVRTLADGVQGRGLHTRIWEGRTDDGARVSSGIYFFRLNAGEFRATRKVVILR